jgi:CRP-like cAMP-binding protein
MSNVFEDLKLFSDFNEKQIKAIFKLGERKLIEADEILFQEGDESLGLYIILGGKFQTTYNGVKKTFTSGAIFSTLSIINTTKHKLTLVSVQKSQYFQLTKEQYDRLKENSPKFALKLQENIIKDYLEKTNKLEKIFLEK